MQVKFYKRAKPDLVARKMFKKVKPDF